MFDVIIEFIGTFVFLSTILFTSEPLAIVASLFAVIYISLKSGGKANFNPAITTVLLAKGDINPMTFVAYVTAQVLGGLLALLVYNSRKM